MEKSDEVIFEFGGGTGQMADVLNNLKFQGKHIIYDLPLMVVLQKYFIDKRNIKTKISQRGQITIRGSRNCG